MGGAISCALVFMMTSWLRSKPRTKGYYGWLDLSRVRYELLAKHLLLTASLDLYSGYTAHFTVSPAVNLMEMSQI